MGMARWGLWAWLGGGLWVGLGKACGWGVARWGLWVGLGKACGWGLARLVGGARWGL